MKEILKAVLGATTVHLMAAACLISLNESPLSSARLQDQNTCVSLVWQGEKNAKGGKLDLITQKTSSTSGAPLDASDARAPKSKDHDVCVKTHPATRQKKVATRAISKSPQRRYRSGENNQSAFVPAALKNTSQISADPLKNVSEGGVTQRSVAKLIPVHMPKPVYPEDARRLRQEGVALVRVWLTKDARVLRCALVRTTGFQSLDRAALRAASLWRFCVMAGTVESALVPVRFSLINEQK